MQTILIVDDDPLVRETLDRSFTAAGFEVHTASDGRAARKILSEVPVHLIILDIIMPDEEGIGFLRKLREGGMTVPVIAVSGGGDLIGTEILNFAAKLGASRVLAKPFGTAELVKMAREELSGEQTGRCPQRATGSVN